MSKTKLIAIRITPEQLGAIDAMSKAMNISRSAVIRVAVSEGLTAVQRKSDWELWNK